MGGFEAVSPFRLVDAGSGGNGVEIGLGTSGPENSTTPSSRSLPVKEGGGGDAGKGGGEVAGLRSSKTSSWLPSRTTSGCGPGF